MSVSIDPAQIKSESERVIAEYGGEVNPHLPFIDQCQLRARPEILARAAILHAMLMIHFEAPTSFIREWIDSHGLSEHLSDWERSILSRHKEELSEQELTDLYWYIEALWALMWVGRMIDAMPFDRPIENYMASLLPNVAENEGPGKIENAMDLRPSIEVFSALDLHYRLHWWVRHACFSDKDTGSVSLDIIVERRKALEWAMDPTLSWDEVPLDT